MAGELKVAPGSGIPSGVTPLGMPYEPQGFGKASLQLSHKSERMGLRGLSVN